MTKRVHRAPAFLVEYLALDNLANGFSEQPRPAGADPAFEQDVVRALTELPRAVAALLTQRLLGIYLVEDLGGTGYTDAVMGSDAKPVGAYVVLDAAVLRAHTANSWATWKERTPFGEGSEHLRARIETDKADSRKNAIQYILLHELGHVVSVGGRMHPFWSDQPRDVGSIGSYPFAEMSWDVDRAANKFVSRFDSQFPQRPSVAYYSNRQLPAEKMVDVYRHLAQTNFVSLYSATNPSDDFAEAFASYVHVVMMGRPWQITISRAGEKALVYEDCWKEERCAAKKRYLQKLMAGRVND